MKNLYVVAKQTVIHVEGESNELGYIVFDSNALFETSEGAINAIHELNLPLSWVAIRLQDLFPTIDAAVKDHVMDCIKYAEANS